MIYCVQKTSARLELMFFLSLMTWVQIVESLIYPSDSFFDCVQAFEKAMTLRFSMIDVNKSLRISRTKGAEEKLKLVNELKIITAPEESTTSGVRLSPEQRMVSCTTTTPAPSSTRRRTGSKRAAC